MKMTSVNLYEEELRPADNDGMKKTAVDHLLGQLAGDGKTHNVKVDLKVKEIWVDESMTPLDRVVTHATLSSTSGIG
jgi:ribosomal protein S3AE